MVYGIANVPPSLVCSWWQQLRSVVAVTNAPAAWIKRWWALLLGKVCQELSSLHESFSIVAHRLRAHMVSLRRPARVIMHDSAEILSRKSFIGQISGDITQGPGDAGKFSFLEAVKICKGPGRLHPLHTAR